jgi:hypothetical protein
MIQLTFTLLTKPVKGINNVSCLANKKKLNMIDPHLSHFMPFVNSEETDGEDRLRTQPYDKRDVHFPIVNFAFLCSNIPVAPAYRIYISQLIQYSRACGFLS